MISLGSNPDELAGMMLMCTSGKLDGMTNLSCETGVFFIKGDVGDLKKIASISGFEDCQECFKTIDSLLKEERIYFCSADEFTGVAAVS